MKLGLDLGTKNIVLSYQDNKSGKVRFRREINGFYKMERNNAFAKNMLINAGVPFIEQGDNFVALGGKAEEIAHAFNKTLRRPMQKGVLAQEEVDAVEIMATIVQSLIGEINEDAVLYYCVPAPAINADVNTDFHQKIAQMIISGYESKTGNKVEGHSINEAHALLLSAKELNGTGISISCLTPGQQVYCNHSLKNIEEVEVGDLVLSQNGKWNKVINTIPSHKNEKVLKISFDNSNQNLEVTKDHKIQVFRKDWQWVEAQELRIGDIVGEAVPLRMQKRNFISYKEKIGNNNKSENKVFEVSNDIARFLGYFLGDGHVNVNKGYIRFDFGPEENHLEDDVENIFTRVFKRSTCSVSKENRNNIRTSTNCKALAKWLKNKCYCKDGFKKVPFNIEELSIPAIQGFVQGLINSDGWVSDDRIGFENVSKNLACSLHQMLGILHINSNLSKRKGRITEIDGRIINNIESEIWLISVTGRDKRILEDVLNNRINSEKTLLLGGKRCGKIRNIEERDYCGTVYDLTVENDHSFTMPGITVHNCGSGMINACYCLFGLPVYSFSIVGSGDWIDLESAKQYGYDPKKPNDDYKHTPTSISHIKEKISLNNMPIDPVERTIYVNYTILIDKIIDGIIKGFKENEDKAKISQPMPIIIAGGTSSPDGFTELFKEQFLKNKPPFEVGEINRSEKPLYAVAEGCLLAAQLHEERN